MKRGEMFPEVVTSVEFWKRNWNSNDGNQQGEKRNNLNDNKKFSCWGPSKALATGNLLSDRRHDNNPRQKGVLSK